LLKKNVDQTAADYSAGPAVTWDTEVYDTDGFHDTGSDTHRITIPSAVNNKYGIFTSCLSLSSVTSGSSAAAGTNLQSGATTGTWSGHTRNLTGNGQATTSAWIQSTTGPILLATGAIYQCGLFCSDTSITVESESTYGLLVLDTFNETMRVLAKMNAIQTAANYSTPAAIAFDGTDVYDTHAIHDPSSNNTKLIIPSALNNLYVVVWAQVQASSVSSSQANSVAIRKGGSLTYTGMGGNSGNNGSSTEAWMQAQTNVIQVAMGDEFEALYHNADTSVDLQTSTCLGLRVVGS